MRVAVLGINLGKKSCNVVGLGDFSACAATA